jgi:hypothetical protein
VGGRSEWGELRRNGERQECTKESEHKRASRRKEEREEREGGQIAG